MTTWRRGDIVLVPITFPDGSGVKLRPALIVSSDHDNAVSLDVLSGSITSNLAGRHHPGKHLVGDWRGAGLLLPSLMQTNIATIEGTRIRRRLGTLAAADLATFAQARRQALDLS